MSYEGITDELREWLRVTTTDDSVAYEIADRIDAAREEALRKRSLELDMRFNRRLADGHLELPRDADGNAIHPGDAVEVLRSGNPWPRHHRLKVHGMLYREGEWHLTEDGYPTVLNRPCDVRIVQADSWERIIEDAVRAGCAGERLDEALPELKARCEALAEAAR